MQRNTALFVIKVARYIADISARLDSEWNHFS